MALYYRSIFYRKHKKLNEKRPNYSKSRDCLSMETVTLENKAGVSYRYQLGRS